MSEALVEVCVKVIGKRTVFLLKGNFFLRPCKLAEHAPRRLLGSLAVGSCDVGDGYGFRAMLPPDPVRIRKIDSDWGGRVAVTCEGGSIDYLGAHALDLFFLETLVNRRVVLEPLCIGADDFSPSGSLHILEIHKGFPCCLASQRVVVVLHETVNEIHGPESVAEPFDIVLVPKPEVTCAVVLHKRSDILLLGIVFSHGCGHLKLFAYLLDCRTVKPPDFIDLLTDNPVRTFHKPAVQAIGNRSLVGRIHHVGIEFLNLGAGYALIEIDGGLCYDIA